MPALSLASNQDIPKDIPRDIAQDPAQDVPSSAAANDSTAKPVVSDIDCALHYRVDGPTDFLFQIHALDGMDQRVRAESLDVAMTDGRPVTHRVYADPGLGHRFLRIHADGGELALRYRATVERAMQPNDADAPWVPVAELPDELLHNLMPTRYCESDLLARAAFKHFGDLPPGAAQVTAIVEWIHENIDYQIGSSQSTTTARDVYLQRAGVCRDFAHLGITFCRALNIPARLVAGYAPFDEPPPDFHAVFEAYLGGRWMLFDATRMSPVERLVRIASGRDAKDLAFATLFGPAVMTSMAPLIELAR